LTPFSIVLVLISALIHSSWNFFTKRGNWPGEFFFWVFFWGVLLYLPFFIGFGVFPSLLTHTTLKLWGLTTSSGFFETIYFLCLVGAYREGDLSLVYPISRSAPLFTQIWAIFFIGEILSGGGISGIVLVMIGLFVISLKNFQLEHLIPQSNPFTSRPYLLAVTAAVASSIYSVIDKVGVQMLHPVLYIWFINLWMTIFTGLYLLLRREVSFWKVWQESKRDILIIAILQNAAYLLVLIALRMSKVSYVVAFRQVGALFGAGMGIFFLKESHWKTRIAGALILTFGLVLIGLAK
jgi:drug/metabolite transporter (DMT)-like permease